MIAPLRILQPLVVPASDPGVGIPCHGTCSYKTGGKPRGSQLCIEIKCKNCCSQAAADAKKTNTSRDPCKSHKIDAVRSPPQATNAPNTVAQGSATPQVLPAALVPPISTSSVPVTSLPNNPSAVPEAQPTVSQHKTSNRGDRVQPLKNPIGKNWQNKKDEAVAIQNQVENLKSKKIQIEEEVKRTVDIILFHKVRH